MNNYIYLFLHFFKGYPVTLSIPATSVSPKTLPGFSLRPLCDTAVLVEHVFETTGSNRAQTRAAGGGWGGLTAGCSKGEGCWYGEGIQMGRKENLPVWGKYDRLYGVV